MSEVSSSLNQRALALATARRVDCPNCRVQANVFYANTEGNTGQVFYKCPYFLVSKLEFDFLRFGCFSSSYEMCVCCFGVCMVLQAVGCQYFQWTDTMDRSSERSNTGQRMDYGLEQRMKVVLEQRLNMLELKMERILDHIKWLQKILCVCIIVVIYGIFVNQLVSCNSKKIITDGSNHKLSMKHITDGYT